MPYIDDVIAHLETDGLISRRESSDSSPETSTQWIAIFIGKDATDIKVEYTYRGEGRPPKEFFPGVKSRGTNPDLFSHVNPFAENWAHDSGYIATSTSKETALTFPRGLEGRGYLYEINFLPEAVDVPTALAYEVINGRLNMETFEILQGEGERSYRLVLDKKHIKGAWAFDVIGEVKEFEAPPPRILHEEYIPNAHYKEPFSPGVKTLAAGVKVIGVGGIAASVALDTHALYKTYQEGKSSGNYDSFFETGTSIIGGWPGAIVVGSRCAKVGAVVGGAVGGVPGAIVGSFVLGTAGSIAGAVAGSGVARKIKHQSSQLLAAEKEMAPASSSIDPILNFSPETSFESLTDRVLAPFVLRPEARVKAQESKPTGQDKPHTPPPQDTSKEKTVSLHDYNTLKYMSAQDFAEWRMHTPTPGKKPFSDHVPFPGRAAISDPRKMKVYHDRLRAQDAAEHPPKGSPDHVSRGAYEALLKKREDEWKRDPALGEALFSGRVPFPGRSGISNPKKMEAYHDLLRVKAAAEHPPASRSTPLPDSGIPHQTYVDPRGADIGSDKPFFTDAHLMYSRQGTQAILDQHFTQQGMPTEEPKPTAQPIPTGQKRTYDREENGVPVGKGTVGLAPVRWSVFSTAAIAGGIEGLKLAPEIPGTASKKPAVKSFTPPKSGIQHQSFVSPYGGDIGSASIFSMEANLPFSQEDTQALLEKSFQSKHSPAESKQKASVLTAKITNHFNAHAEQDPTTPAHQATRAHLLDEIRTQIDGPTFENLKTSINSGETTLDQAKQFLDDFRHQRHQFEVLRFEKAMETLEDIRFVQGEISGLQKTFLMVEQIGRRINCPKFVKVTQTGLGLLDVAQRFTDIFSAKAMGDISKIGLMAITGNFMSLGSSIVSLIFSFFSPGPSAEEVIFDYLKHMTKHFDGRFDFVDQSLAQIREQLTFIRDNIFYLIDLAKANLELSKQISKQVHGVQQILQLGLEKIQSLLQGIYNLVKAGFDENLFLDFRATLWQLEHALTQTSPALDPLLDKIAAKHIIGMSKGRYLNGGCLADRALLVKELTPEGDNIIFSGATVLDENFMRNPKRHEQALHLDQVFSTQHDPRFLLGFHAAYVHALLDELKSLPELNAEIDVLTARQKVLHEQNQHLDTTLGKPSTTDTKLDQNARLGQFKKQTEGQQEHRQITRRLEKLHELKSLRLKEQETQDRTLAEIEEKMLHLSDRAQTLTKNNPELTDSVTQLDKKMQFDPDAQSPMPPQDKEAEEWFTRHLEQEFSAFELLRTEQHLQNLPLDTRRAHARTHPSFDVIHSPTWVTAVQSWLKGLAHPSLNKEEYVQVHRHAVDDMIVQAENTLGFQDLIRKNPLLFKHLWRAYVTSLLFIKHFYEKGYQAHRSQIPHKTKTKYLLESKLKPTLLRVGEKDYVEQLLKDPDLKRYLLIMHIQKKLLTSTSDLVGTPPAIMEVLHQLPDQHDVETQLHHVLQRDEPAAFSQDSLYKEINQVAMLLSETLFNPASMTLPSPEETIIGAPIAATLQQLNQLITLPQARASLENLNQQPFTRVYTHFRPKTPPQPSPIKTTIPERSTSMLTPETHNEPKPAEPTLSKISFTKTMHEAILRANLGCMEAALWLVGMTGTSKSLFTAALIGCKLKMVPNLGKNNEYIPFFIDIESCPDDGPNPIVGNGDKSQTTLPTAFMRRGHNPVGVVDTAGLLENRPEMRLFTMIASQIGVQTTQAIRGIPLMVPNSRLKDVRASELRRDLRVLAAMFKQPLDKHKTSLHLVITQFDLDKPPSKQGVINQLETISDAANELAVLEPSIENINFAELVKFFISPEGTENIVIFHPFNTASLDVWVESAMKKPAIPPSELTLAGTEEVKMAFMKEFDQVLTDSANVLNMILKQPEIITPLEQKERELKDWLASNSPTTEKAEAKTSTEKTDDAKTEQKPTLTPLEHLKNLVDQAKDDIKSNLDELTKKKEEKQKKNDEILTLSENNQLETVLSIYRNEEADHGSKTKLASVKDGPPDAVFVPMITRAVPASIARTYKLETYQGDPYTLVSDHSQTDCPHGGKTGQVTYKANPKEGTFEDGVMVTAESCNSIADIKLQSRFNELPKTKKKILRLETAVEQDGVKITELEAREIELKATKLDWEKKYTAELLKHDHHQKEKEAAQAQDKIKEVNAKQGELHDTQASLQRERTTFNHAVAQFTENKSAFQSIEGFYQVIGVDIDAGLVFHKAYVAVLKQLDLANTYPNIARCTPKPPPAEPAPAHNVPDPITLEQASASLRNSFFGGKESSIRVDVQEQPHDAADKSPVALHPWMIRFSSWVRDEGGLRPTAGQRGAPTPSQTIMK